MPVTTDVHDWTQPAQVAQVVDLAANSGVFVSPNRFVERGGRIGGEIWRRGQRKKRPVFAARRHGARRCQKVREAGCANVLLTERGTTFGYDSLVVDYRGFEVMRQWAPICLDATHAVQRPGGAGDKTGGDRRFVPALVRAACAVGVDALFLETHPNPDSAWSDGPNMIPLAEMEALLRKALAIRAASA